jgi:hypothetical protein
MPIATQTKVLELKDAKIAPLTADPSGGSATYGASVDIPGILKLDLSPNAVTKELRGDNVLMDIYSKVESVGVAITNAILPLDVLKLLMGGAVTASGTTPNQKQTYDLAGADLPGYVKIEGQALYVDTGIGDVHVIFHKCKATVPPKWSFADNSGDFVQVTATLTAIPLQATGNKLMSVVLNETATAIS